MSLILCSCNGGILSVTNWHYFSKEFSVKNSVFPLNSWNVVFKDLGKIIGFSIYWGFGKTTWVFLIFSMVFFLWCFFYDIFYEACRFELSIYLFLYLGWPARYPAGTVLDTVQDIQADRTYTCQLQLGERRGFERIFKTERLSWFYHMFGRWIAGFL